MIGITITIVGYKINLKLWYLLLQSSSSRILLYCVTNANFVHPRCKRRRVCVSNVSAKIEFNLYNALQQKVKSINLPAEMIEYQMKCNDLVNGVYFYTLKQGDEILSQGKISIIN